MLTIGEVAARVGLRASAVRYYEAQGLLSAASRRGGKRVYDAAILDRLGMIALAKRAGFELHEIRDSLAAAGEILSPPSWKRRGKAKRIALDQRIARLTEMKDVLAKLDGCRCDTLEQCGRAFNSVRALAAQPGASGMPEAARSCK
jgi:MerR family redox-sensitive transcriptional activator SoxR